MGGEDAKLFVGGLSQETTKESLRSHFSQHGTLTDAVVMYDLQSGRSRGFGFVTFESSESLQLCLSTPQTVDGKEVDCKRACPRDVMTERQNSAQSHPTVGLKTNKIFVGGLPDLTEDEFRNYFAKFGTVVDAVLMTDKATNKPRGFGFVTYESPDIVEQVVRRYHEHRINDKWVEVKKAQSKEQLMGSRNAPQNSRGGGGGSFGPYPAGGYSSPAYGNFPSDYYGYRGSYGGYEQRRAYAPVGMGFDPYAHGGYAVGYGQEAAARKSYSPYGPSRSAAAGNGYRGSAAVGDPYGGMGGGYVQPMGGGTAGGYNSQQGTAYISSGYGGGEAMGGNPPPMAGSYGGPYDTDPQVGAYGGTATGPAQEPGNPYSTAVYGYAPQRGSGRGSSFSNNRAYPY